MFHPKCQVPRPNTADGASSQPRLDLSKNSGDPVHHNALPRETQSPAGRQRTSVNNVSGSTRGALFAADRLDFHAPRRFAVLRIEAQGEDSMSFP